MRHGELLDQDTFTRDDIKFDQNVFGRRRVGGCIVRNCVPNSVLLVPTAHAEELALPTPYTPTLPYLVSRHILLKLQSVLIKGVNDFETQLRPIALPLGQRVVSFSKKSQLIQISRCVYVTGKRATDAYVSHFCLFSI